MQHRFAIDGFCYKLRPVQLSDAQFILNLRLEDSLRNQYIHEVPNDINIEIQWLQRYFEREGDYFFIIENKLSGLPEGTIAIYDAMDGRAEWGRWVIQKGSLAAVESVALIYKVAFSLMNLQELYCRTIHDNSTVISFHDSLPQKKRGILKGFFELHGKMYDAVEHYVTKDYYFDELESTLEKKSFMVFKRNLRMQVGKFEFHHIGIACNNISRDMGTFQMLGYCKETKDFIDTIQGIHGTFMSSVGQPRIELLENIQGSTTLTPYLDKGIKLYHFAYTVSNIEKACELLLKSRAKIVSPLKISTYFGKRICFLMLPNMFLVELVEE